MAGWVSNRDAGAVVAVFEDEAGAVQRLVELCRSGPGRAEVESLDVSSEEPEGLTDFRIV
jgi:acylphosphatase